MGFFGYKWTLPQTTRQNGYIGRIRVSKWRKKKKIYESIDN